MWYLGMVLKARQASELEWGDSFVRLVEEQSRYKKTIIFESKPEFI